MREAPLLREDEPVGEAVRTILAAELPALPVVDSEGHVKGVFGEREFIAAIFPGYLKEMRYAGFLKKSLGEALELNEQCVADPVSEHMTTDHVDVGADWTDVSLAETFLHHRVLIVPVVRDERVIGVVTRSDFFRAIAERAGGGREEPPGS